MKGIIMRDKSLDIIKEENVESCVSRLHIVIGIITVFVFIATILLVVKALIALASGIGILAVVTYVGLTCFLVGLICTWHILNPKDEQDTEDYDRNDE